jgi:hypothetical protein
VTQIPNIIRRSLLLVLKRICIIPFFTGYGSSFGGSIGDLSRGGGMGGGGGFANDGYGMEGGVGFGGSGGGGGDYILKMRGLPFSATPADVADVSTHLSLIKFQSEHVTLSGRWYMRDLYLHF